MCTLGELLKARITPDGSLKLDEYSLCVLVDIITQGLIKDDGAESRALIQSSDLFKRQVASKQIAEFVTSPENVQKLMTWSNRM